MAIIPSAGKAQYVTSFRESFISTDIYADPLRIVEDAGWSNLTTDAMAVQTARDMNPQDRRNVIGRARQYWRMYPLAKQAIRLFTTYVLGQGVSYHADDSNVQKVLDDFWNDPDNRLSLTTAPAQKTLLTRLRVDGEIIIFLFVDKETGRVKVRVGEPLEIDDIIPDPEDEARPLYYKRRWTKRTYDYGSEGTWKAGESATAYYAAIDNAALPHKPPQLNKDAVILHVKINALGQRGISDLYAALDYLSVHRTYIEDIATFMHSKASVAWVKKTKGGANQVNASAALDRSSASGPLGALGARSYESNPPPATASTKVLNPAVDLQGLTMDSGVAGTEAGGRMLMTQVGAATGIMLHYFGDGGDANLATATAMDLPMLKLFEDGQEEFKDMLLAIFMYVVLQAVKAGTLDGTIEDRDGREVVDLASDEDGVYVDFPLIVQRDTLAMTQATTSMKQAGGISSELYARQCATLLAVDDVDQAVEDAMAEKQQAKDEAAAIAQQGQQPLSVGGTGSSKGSGATTNADKPDKPDKTSGDGDNKPLPTAPASTTKPTSPTTPPLAPPAPARGKGRQRAAQVAKGGIR